MAPLATDATPYDEPDIRTGVTVVDRDVVDRRCQAGEGAGEHCER
jgi:hypothetical protein